MTSLAVSREGPGSLLEAALDSLDVRGREPVLAAVRRFPAEPAREVPFPDEMHPRLAEALRARGIEQLYSHQAEAWRRCRRAAASRWSRPPPRARRSATTCRCSTAS